MTVADAKPNFVYLVAVERRSPPVEAVRVMNAIEISLRKEFNTILTNKEGTRAIILSARSDTFIFY